MTFFYNLAFLIFGIFYFPVFLLKLRQAAEPRKLLAERMGFYKNSAAGDGRRTVWLHAVSVGEVMAVRPFIRLFLERYPDYDLVLTTVTPTGQRIAAELESSRVRVHYFPFDFAWAQRNFLKTFQPELVLLAETEIWPNLLSEAAREEIPVGIVNARLSPRSAKRYAGFRFIFEPLFEKIAFILVQTEEDAARFRMAGAADSKLHVLGNMKFDSVKDADDLDPSWKTQWGIKSGDLVWISGSTHPGEEEKLLKAFIRLRRKFPQLKWILAPRHIERTTSLLEMIKNNSEMKAVTAAGRKAETAYDILVLDQMGILRRLYQLADVVFMGGSFVPHGGQNPIEPACFKKAVLYGPHVFNFQKVYETLAHDEGAVQVAGEDELEKVIERLLQHPQERNRTGQNAFASVRRLQGASRRHLDWLASYLGPEERNQNVHERLFPQTGGRL